MVKKLKLSTKSYAIIVAFHKIGKSNRKIARKLNISRRTVNYNVEKCNSTSSFKNKPRSSGRPRATSSLEDISLVVCSKQNRRLTTPEITAQLKETKENKVSVSSVKRHLNKAGLYGGLFVKKLLSKAVYKAKRSKETKEHNN